MIKYGNFIKIPEIIFLLLFLPLFFYNLGQSSLSSWDEAWYAEISKNIIDNKNLFHLKWNDWDYYDHPPIGFWLTSISFLFLGIDNFSARFAQALTGFLCLILTYLLGRIMFNRFVGFFSAVALSTSFWFILRSRSGNLDISLTFFFLLTFYFSVLSFKNKKYLIPLSLSLSALFLSKTLVPLTILPVLLVIFWRNKLKLKDFILPLVIFSTIFGGWFIDQLFWHENFINRYLMIGYPGANSETNIVENLILAKEYLHNGIGKWFWPGVIGTFGGFIIFKRFNLALSLFNIIFFLPFIFSAKGHIWHLIPMHPTLIISFFGFSFFIIQFIFNKLSIKNSFYLSGLILGVFTFYIFQIQIKQIYYQIISQPRYISDEEILSKEASKYNHKLIIDGDFGPTAVFYSQKQVDKFSLGDLRLLFKDDPFLLITNEWRLKDTSISATQYRIIKKDRDKVLIIKE